LTQIGQAATFHVDHIVPRSLNGATDEQNLALQCPSCSLHKSNKVAAPDPVDGTVTPLFHPRQHQWSEHIGVSRDGFCFGTTAIGRATVAALRMNDELPRLARSMQIQFGLLKISRPN
jgi:hypothetical protein